MQKTVKLNDQWLFYPDFKMDYLNPDSERIFEKINIPHTVREIPYDGFDQTITCLYSTYVRYFVLPDPLPDRVLITFYGVSACYDLYLNGEKIASHKGAYSEETFDLTDKAIVGNNRLLLMVDSHERSDVPPNGSTVDYLIYGGIYRDVVLSLKESRYIEKVKLSYSLKLSEDGRSGDLELKPEIFIRNAADEENDIFLISLSLNGKKVCSYQRENRTLKGSSVVIPDEFHLEKILPWSLENPVLYDFEICLCHDGKIMDIYSGKTGFRNIKVTAKGFFLNEKKIKLIGINRHQSFPYIGYAMGKRAQRKDALILLEYGFNIVRCSHYMQSDYFIDCCDENGLLVFEEIPGWGHIGNEKYKEISFNDLRNMINGHYNHPSIAIWGTRLNETLDDDSFYSQTNALAKQLDHSRPTSGVRWEEKSHLLEDIYSYNDYTPADKNGWQGLLEPQKVTGLTSPVPYLVSEHTGPLLPTKPGDSEERQEQFALLHANAVRDALIGEGYLGALAWCAFDYNTHNDNNSLEKICYHGIFDMFRVPKMAAFFYKSQLPIEKEIVMEPCSLMGRGERCEPVPFWVMTNCDFIEVKLSSDLVRRYYPSTRYLGLKHPPIEVTKNGEFWQERWQGSVMTGYCDGKAVIQKKYSDNPHICLQVTADDMILSNEEQDETRIVCLFTDENRNRMYFHSGALSIETEGEISLIGPSIRAAMGGAVAFWIRTRASKIKGKAAVIIHTDRSDIPDQKIDLQLNA